MQTITFRGHKGSATYRCTCRVCGKEMTRTATVEHTVNPFNKNEGGSVKSAAEVQRDAYAAAEAEAVKLATEPAICRDCEEAPTRSLLLAMAAEPLRVFPRPDPFFASPMHILEGRKHVGDAYENCSCGAPCCSGWKSLGGYRITATGVQRAKSLTAKAESGQ